MKNSIIQKSLLQLIFYATATIICCVLFIFSQERIGQKTSHFQLKKHLMAETESKIAHVFNLIPQNQIPLHSSILHAKAQLFKIQDNFNRLSQMENQEETFVLFQQSQALLEQIAQSLKILDLERQAFDRLTVGSSSILTALENTNSQLYEIQKNLMSSHLQFDETDFLQEIRTAIHSFIDHLQLIEAYRHTHSDSATLIQLKTSDIARALETKIQQSITLNPIDISEPRFRSQILHRLQLLQAELGQHQDYFKSSLDIARIVKEIEAIHKSRETLTSVFKEHDTQPIEEAVQPQKVHYILLIFAVILSSRFGSILMTDDNKPRQDDLSRQHAIELHEALRKKMLMERIRQDEEDRKKSATVILSAETVILNKSSDSTVVMTAAKKPF